MLGETVEIRQPCRRFVEGGACRRAGGATARVEDALALARARGRECVTLEGETDNAGARRLYEKLGFRGESLRSPLAFFKYGTWAWNKDILRLGLRLYQSQDRADR